LTSPALMAERTTQSGSDGSYLFDFLPLGSYEVTITAKGFKSYVQKDVIISSGFVATVSPHLQVGVSGETVEVSGEAPIVDVKSVTTLATFDDNLLQNIPSGGDPWSPVAKALGLQISNLDVGGTKAFSRPPWRCMAASLANRF